MIGEHVGGEIPVGGVMFTEEAEGGISYKDEKDVDGRIKTTGITLIQAAPGHTQLVVNSLGVVDSFVAQKIDDEHVFYPVIRAKRERLKPSAGKLVMTKNPANLITAPALNEQILITLKKFANALENYYKYPMDVEFVVREGVIWIVQARPIVHKEERKLCRPGYFADVKALPQETLFKGRTIGAFGGGIVEVVNKEDCIISERIGTALDLYLKSDRRVKCIFSGTDAPATSHEATTFRSEGKPVLYVEDISGLQNTFVDGKKLIFSPQQHCVAVLDPMYKPEIKDGWCAYPLPRSLSVDPILFFGEKNFVMPQRVVGAIDLSGLLQQVCSENIDTAMQGALQISGVIAESIFRKMKFVKVDQDLSEQSKLIIRAAKVLGDRIVALCVLKAPPLERLLPVNYLDALVHQQQFGGKELRYLSLANLSKALKQERAVTPVMPIKQSLQGRAYSLVWNFYKKVRQALSLPLKEAADYHMQLKKVAGIIFDENTLAAWNRLIDTLIEGNVQHIQTLGSVIATLQSFDILPLWLHSTMVHKIEALGTQPSVKRCIEFVKQSAQEIQASSQSFDLIKNLSNKVAQFNVGRFADHKKFESTWADFEKLTARFMAPKFIDIVKTATTDESKKLAGAAACGLMAKFVDVFDASIKSLTGIDKKTIDGQLHAQLFQIMLRQYYALLENWVNLVPDGAISYSRDFGVDHYLLLMRAVTEKSEVYASDLEATRGYSATGATIGSGANAYDLGPQALEDVFTVIHQSLLVVCGALNRVCIGNDLNFPMLVHQLEDMMKDAVTKLNFFRTSVSLIGINIHQAGIVAHYNMPLRNHSCQFFISYNNKAKAVDLKFELFGHHPNRWYDIAAFACLSKLAKKCFIKEFSVCDGGFLCIFEVDNLEKKLDSTILSSMIDGTFDPASLSFPLDTFTGAIIRVENLPTQQRLLLNCLWYLVPRVSNDQDNAAFFDKAVKEAFGAMGDANYNRGLELFKVLVDKDYKPAFEAATVAAEKAVVAVSVDIRFAGLELFKVLVDKDYKPAFKAATAAAKKAMRNEVDRVRYKREELARAIAMKNKKE